MKLDARIDRLERDSGSASLVKYHLLARLHDQTEDEAIDVYGRDKVGPGDDFIFLVAPPAR